MSGLRASIEYIGRGEFNICRYIIQIPIMPGDAKQHRLERKKAKKGEKKKSGKAFPPL